MARTLKLSAAAAMLAAFALASTINSYLPTRENVLAAPFVRTSVMGEDVQLRTGSVSVSQVGVAKQVRWQGQVAKTPGAFLTFSLTYIPNGTEPAVGPVEVVGGDGKVFGGLQAGSRSLVCGGSQADLPITCDLAVEVSPTSLAGAKVRVHNLNSVAGDDQALIDLQLDAPAAQSLLEKAGEFEISAPRHGGEK